MTGRMPARDAIAQLLEDVQPLDEPAILSDPLAWPGYRDAHAAARDATDVDEAVIAVRGRIRGSDTEAILVVWDFRFLGGSMGIIAGQRIAAAYETASRLRLPVVLLPSTGGARMQEGMAALAQMAATVVASRRHAAAGLLQVAWLGDPTTGGVFASHANLSDVLLAAPRATIGFAGPRVAEAQTGASLPADSHTAEGALSAGLVDGVVDLRDLPAVLRQILRWPGSPEPSPLEVPTGERSEAQDAWTEVARARAVDRPRAAAFLEPLDVAFELRGDRAGGDDPAVRVVCVTLAGRSAIVIALDRDGHDGRVTPAGYRKAWRGIDLATRLGVPIITLIDTPGADASPDSERAGIAHHIARTFAELLAAPVPVVPLVIGEGGSGGALALAVGDHLLIQEHAIFSVIAPESAAVILYRDETRSDDVARRLRLTAQDLVDLGIADAIVPEPAGHAVTAGLAAVTDALDRLASVPSRDLVATRQERWRSAGR